MPAQAPLFIALTADVDPDANRPVEGRPDAVTSGDPEGRARTDASLKGMHVLLDLLGDRALPATFFYEGRTLDALAAREPALLQRLRAGTAFEHGCHGWCHEDFAGSDSGLPLSAPETRRALKAAGQAFSRAFGRPPTAFRAPYCRLTPHLAAALPELGYRYDTSETRIPSGQWPMQPYRLGRGTLYELPLTRWRDRRGRAISCYLWQLCEGRRPVRDYLDMAEALRARFPGGLLQFALHPWHLVVSERNQPLSDSVGRLSELLSELHTRDGLAFTTVGAYLDQAAATA
jgi:hypothetical protein